MLSKLISDLTPLLLPIIFAVFFVDKMKKQKLEKNIKRTIGKYLPDSETEAEQKTKEKSTQAPTLPAETVAMETTAEQVPLYRKEQTVAEVGFSGNSKLKSQVVPTADVNRLLRQGKGTSLQEAFIMAEILAPPLAKRKGKYGGFTR